MVPLTVHTAIAASREEVYDFVVDLANRTAWMDHWQAEMRLTNPRSSGVGAAARYRLRGRSRQWMETHIVEADRPRRIVETTTGGRLNLSRGEIVFDFSRQGRSLTRVEMSVATEAGTIRERFFARFGSKGRTKRQAKVALQRLRAVFEEERDEPLARATVAGWEPHKAPRFGVELADQPDVHTGSGRRASSG
jgi:uncharacterized protein YndB with AHSA1/START domain